MEIYPQIIISTFFYLRRPQHNSVFINIKNPLNENNDEFSKNHQKGYYVEVS